MSKNNTPPEDFRYKPGQSGNPNGRPKGAKNKKNRPPQRRKLHPMDEKIHFPVGGKLKRITRSQALVLYAQNRALKERDPRLDQLILSLDEALCDTAGAVDYDSWIEVWHGGSSYQSNYIEDVFCRVGVARMLDPNRDSGRMMFEPWVITRALARLGDRRLSREQQQLVVAATRMAHTVK